MRPYYEHTGVTIYHGDCAEVLAKLDIQPALFLTSPPYDNLRDYGRERYHTPRREGLGTVGNRHRDISAVLRPCGETVGSRSNGVGLMKERIRGCIDKR